MNTSTVTAVLKSLFSELADGAPSGEAYILNRSDRGLLRSLDKLTAEEASASVNGGASIAAHADHLRYGLTLMNRWAAGENPFGSADWSASWRKTTVSAEEWSALRAALTSEAHRWLEALGVPREVSQAELNGVVGSIAHLAYHLGAIRQIAAAARGPQEPQSAG